MLELSLGMDKDVAKALAVVTLTSGKAYAKFKEWISLQGGDPSYAEDFSLFGASAFVKDIKATCDGYVLSCNAETIGLAAMKLGAGRETKEDVIDFKAGIELLKKPTDPIKSGEVIARLYTDKEESLASAEELVLSAFKFGEEKPDEYSMIYFSVR